MTPLMPEITVNGRVIPATDIAAEAQNHNAPADKPGWAWKAAARALVVRALLLQEADNLGLAPAPQMITKGKQETDDESLIRAVLEQRIDIPNITEMQCRDIYDTRTGSFRAPSLFQPAHILFAARPEDKDARKMAKQGATAALTEVTKNPKNFARVAKELSACPSKDNGGALGQIGSGDTVPEFEAVLNILKAGELHTEVVETRFGFHIIRMDEKIDGDILPFASVMPQIMEKLEQIAWAKAARTLTLNLVTQAKIIGIDMANPKEKAA
ncbi:MAG: peptidylprolyl isomerase [Paracoccaceae bacterium]